MADKVQELDEDLTMINKPQLDASDQALLDLSKTGKVVGSFRDAPTNKAELGQAVQRSQDAESFAGSLSNEAVDPDLDRFKSMYEDTSTTRARNQSETVKGLKAVGGGIYQGSLIALEQMGYVADLDTYTNLFKDNEDLSGNWWTGLMKDAQDAGRESELFKIYEDDPNENSIAAQIFKWTSLEGAISSAIGFGITGLGAASVVSAIGATRKFQALAKFTDAAMGNLKGVSAFDAAIAAGKTAEQAKRLGTAAAMTKQGATAAFAGPLASSMMSNYYMGQMMASDTYTQSMQALKDGGAIGDGEDQMTEFEAQKLSNSNAQDVVGLNMALTATAYLKFGGIFKAKRNTRALLTNPTAVNQLKDMIVKGSPTAFTENVYQEMIQMEQIHDTSVEGKIASEYSANYWDRITQLALSNRAVHAGALGIVGGPIQFAVIQKPMMRKQNKYAKEQYDKQKLGLDYIESLKDTNLKTFGEFDTAHKEAILQGDKGAIDIAENLGTIHELTKLVEMGTIEILRKDIEDIQNMTTEEAVKAEYDPATYKEIAGNLLQTIDKTVEIADVSVGYENIGEVVYNQMSLDMIAAQATADGVKYKQTVEGLVKRLENESSLPADFIRGLAKTGLVPVRLKARFEGLSVQQKADLIATEQKQDVDLATALESAPEMKSIMEMSKSLEKTKALVKELVDRRTKITDPKYQKAYKADQDKNIKNVNKLVAEDNAKKEDTESKEKASKFEDFQVIKNAAKFETPAERTARDKEFSSKVSGKAVIKEGRTFTSYDAKGERREFGKRDLGQSYDGRYFQVKRQAYSGKDGTLVSSPMPVLQETDAKGKYIKGSKEFVPDDINFLRPEILQADNIKSDKYTTYVKNWAAYSAPDSVLKPFNRGNNLARQTKAEQGLVISVNNFEYKNNRPNGPLELTEFAKVYDTHLLNKPFTGTYDVEFKIHKNVGEDTMIDVYSKDENGKEIRLTRLDRNSNLNYLALTNALAKGPVTGAVTGHYSSSNNLVVVSDKDGNKIYSSIDEMNTAMPKHHLINGKVHIASVTGKGSDKLKTYVVSQDGKDIYTDGKIPVKVGTETKMKNVPFRNMKAGDSVALILASNGEIMPVSLSSLNVKDLPSNIEKGKTLADDLMDEHFKSVREYFATVVDDLAEFEAGSVIANTGSAEVNSAVELNNQLLDSELSRANAFDKNDIVWTNRKGLQEAFGKNVYKTIRSTYTYAQEKKGDDWKTVTNFEGKPVFRADYFQMYAAVDSRGKIVPAVKVRNPNNSAGTHTYNVTDHAEQYAFVMNNRRRKFNIDDFVNPIQEINGKEVNVIDRAIKNGELITDLNIPQPIAGSSATIQVHGEDMQKEGFKAAQANRDTYKTKRNSTVAAVSEATKVDFIEELNEDFETQINSMDVNETPENYIGYLRQLFINKDFYDTIELTHLVNQAFTTEGIPGTEVQYEKVLNEIQPNADAPVPNATLHAKATVLLSVVNDKINSGELKLQLKDASALEVDPGKYKTQKEDITFGISSTAYHSTYGMVEVTKPLTKGYYFVQEVNKTKNPHKVWAKDMYSKDGDFKKWFAAKKELTAAIAKGDKELIRRKSSNVDSIHKKLISAGFMGEKSDKKSADSAKNDSTSNTNGGSPTINTELVEMLNASYIKHGDFEKVAKFHVSDRTEAIKSSIIKINNMKEEFKKLGMDPMMLGTEFTAAIIDPIVSDSIKAIPYTLGELDVLIAAADSKEKFGVSPKQKTYFGHTSRKLSNMRNLLEALLDAQAGKGTSHFIEVSYQGAAIIVAIPSLNKAPDKTSISAYPDVQNFVGPILGRAVGTAIIAESEINTNMFDGSMGSAKVDTPSTANKDNVSPVKKAEVVTPVTPAVVVPKVIPPVVGKVKPIKTVVVETADSYKSQIDSGMPGAPQSVKDELEFKVTRMAATMGKGPAQKILTGMIAKNAKQYAVTENMTKTKEEEDVDTYFDDMADDAVPFKRGDKLTSTPEEFKAEVADAKRMLPKVPLEVVENLAEMHKKFGEQAIGAYDKGVRFLVQNAEKGSAYHETMHAVAKLYLRPIERKQIAEEYGFDAWSLKVDERLAEDFEKYMDNYNKGGVLARGLSAVKRFFNSMLSYVKGARSADMVKQVFEKTVNGGYASDTSINYLSNVAVNELKSKNMSDFLSSLSAKESVTLQNMLDTNKIKIVC